jgi:hypothetical protein
VGGGEPSHENLASSLGSRALTYPPFVTQLSLLNQATRKSQYVPN